MFMPLLYKYVCKSDVASKYSDWDDHNFGKSSLTEFGLQQQI
jgi:hypothetical protein